jgi:hypothetical protein
MLTSNHGPPLARYGSVRLAATPHVHIPRTLVTRSARYNYVITLYLPFCPVIDMYEVVKIVSEQVPTDMRCDYSVEGFSHEVTHDWRCSEAEGKAVFVVVKALP